MLGDFPVKKMCEGGRREGGREVEWSGVEWCGGEPGRPDGINSPTKDEKTKNKTRTRARKDRITQTFFINKPNWRREAAPPKWARWESTTTRGTRESSNTHERAGHHHLAFHLISLNSSELYYQITQLTGAENDVEIQHRGLPTFCLLEMKQS